MYLVATALVFFLAFLPCPEAPTRSGGAVGEIAAIEFRQLFPCPPGIFVQSRGVGGERFRRGLKAGGRHRMAGRRFDFRGRRPGPGGATGRAADVASEVGQLDNLEVGVAGFVHGVSRDGARADESEDGVYHDAHEEGGG